MLAKSKKPSKKITRTGKTDAIVKKSVKNYGDDPFFVKKADKAKEMIDKYGFPKDLKL